MIVICEYLTSMYIIYKMKKKYTRFLDNLVVYRRRTYKTLNKNVIIILSSIKFHR